MSDAKFEKAVGIVRELPKDGPIKPTQDQQLVFYKYYKQATEGDVKDARPDGFLEFASKAKWDAWNSVKGTKQDVAKKWYVELLLEILGKSEDEDAKERVKEIENA